MEEIIIREPDNKGGGFIVNVGCKTFCFPKTERGIHELCFELGQFLRDPIKYREEFYEEDSLAKRLRSMQAEKESLHPTAGVATLGQTLEGPAVD